MPPKRSTGNKRRGTGDKRKDMGLRIWAPFLKRAQQAHVVSITVGLSVRTLVSKLPQQEHFECQENGELSKGTSNGNNQERGRERNPINQSTVTYPSSDSEVELLDIIPSVTKEMRDTLTGKGTLQAAPINNVAISSTDSDLVASAHTSLSTMIRSSI